MPDITNPPCKADIVIAVDSSNSVYDNGNRDNMKNFVKGIIDNFSNELNSGKVRIGLVHFDNGMCGNQRKSPGATVPSSMHGPIDVHSLATDKKHIQYLTDDIGSLHNWAEVR